MKTLLNTNLQSLKQNPYPGRGMVIGQSPDAGHYIQIYWIMGRSENSRNRIFVEEDGFVKTEAFDKERVTDPSLIIYYPIRSIGGRHIVSNGDQTDTIFESLKKGETFESALNTREFEPDAPHYTPRISGIVDLDDPKHAYKLSILKPVCNNPEYGIRQYFNYEKAVPGVGHCIHTYAQDGDPLPSFDGEPYLVGLPDDLDETAQLYWETLNEDNRISLTVKRINVETGETALRIINKNQ